MRSADAAPPAPALPGMGAFVRAEHAAGRLVVQPRMGMSDPAVMRAGLLATRDCAASTVGTVTLDSFTRLNQFESVAEAMRDGLALNGYPIVNYDTEVTRRMLDGVVSPRFPVQVRHGSASPVPILRAMVAAGLHATEGGPVSYCLPYGRTPLADSVENWIRSCAIALEARDYGFEPHLETFGGCLLGQLCPPGELVAVSMLEALFFREQGVRSISVSYAQQTSPAQDREAVAALRRLCRELLPDAETHVVLYAYMGLFPQTAHGARALLAEAARLAVATRAERLIVKTVAEAHRLPTVAENVEALEGAAAAARTAPAAEDAADGEDVAGDGGSTYLEARALIEATLGCAPRIGPAILGAFRRGLLDVPFCPHPDNAARARSYIAADGTLRWAELGSLPLRGQVEQHRRAAFGSADLMAALSYVRDRFDRGPADAALSPGRRPARLAAAGDRP